MTTANTRAYMATLTISQHHGWPHTPTDQVWIESFFGHIKGKRPHLEAISDPAVIETEFERIRRDCNGLRLHQGIGYVTPDDEHQGRDITIRQARIEGLRRAHHSRLAYHHRNHTNASGDHETRVHSRPHLRCLLRLPSNPS